ncbi:MAG: hypothetical protein CVU50_05460 [Candidatus Cloacimonetes bacterium HGW-Cloacimonetes-3]|jgi:Fe-S cluster assembly iron-binding protein IscA|nr:MAG: hypothetical protein CVU50_05460 [Candidatus Cloacimonetes bacterium HGW-Cloacimonetes-3]PKN96366.1 MAG: hypothetical protein CVU43_21080 [Chloroflexi bacterium HGW-Chloroflexi-5]
MNITISESARRYIKRKQEFYRYQSRKPHIILVAKSCKGAEFRLVYGLPAADDIVQSQGDCEIYVSKSLLDEYGGFSLDTELFFFAQRLLVQPLEQTYACDCKQKCKIKEDR